MQKNRLQKTPSARKLARLPREYTSRRGQPVYV